MGWLEVSFKIGLAHPLLVTMTQPNVPIMVDFPETGNTVYLEPPDSLPVTKYQSDLGAFDRMTLRVRRQCSDQEGRNAALANFGNGEF